ncbi:MAG: SURF1 family cytochrome oxidase biogenesis protein [Pseudomonadota bacterium]
MNAPSEDTRRPLWVDAIILSCSLVLFVSLIGLGNWQVRRLEWKLSLIEAVEARAYSEAAPLPSEPVTADGHAYLRVRAEGIFDHTRQRRVKAVTELGPGSWLMTPLKTENTTVWINRGFVPSGAEDLVLPEGAQTIEGWLRITEPGGTLLEKNDPEAGRWYSRDVEALSADAAIEPYAPFFVDADIQAGAEPSWPRAGLTQLAFRNPHLSYAITWYAMAALFAAAMGTIIWGRVRG